MEADKALSYLRAQAEKVGRSGLCAFVLDNANFARWPGSCVHHHAYPGGLAVHTAEVLEYALGMAEVDSWANKEVLTVAAIFHDYAKLRDYQEDSTTPSGFRPTQYRDRIRHVSGSHAFYIVCTDGVETPFNDEVSHCILSHHGRQEWGSPVEPQTLEAHILHYADMLSARHGKGKL